MQRIALRSPNVAVSHAGALELGRRYWEEVERWSRRLVRARRERDELELVLGGLVLFRFGKTETHVGDHEVECRFPITGGLLVARPGGSLSIVQRTRPAGELVVILTGYRPRLESRRSPSVRRLVYSRIQVSLHDAVSRRFLTRVAEDST